MSIGIQLQKLFAIKTHPIHLIQSCQEDFFVIFPRLIIRIRTEHVTHGLRIAAYNRIAGCIESVST